MDQKCKKTRTELSIFGGAPIKVLGKIPCRIEVDGHSITERMIVVEHEADVLNITALEKLGIINWKHTTVGV